MNSLSNLKNCRMMLILTLLRKLSLFTTVIPPGLSQTWTTHCNLLNQQLHHTLSSKDVIYLFMYVCMFFASVLYYQNILVSFITGKGTLWISTSWTQLCTSLKEAAQGKPTKENELGLVKCYS